MENIQKAYLLFEQSGTFKNQFLSLGIPAEDFDILNDYGETDHVIDLFVEIENAYCGKLSIFDSFGVNDLIMAFFPCVRFSCQFSLVLRQDGFQWKNLSLSDKLGNAIKYHRELNEFYVLISKLAKVCIDRGLRLVIENPYRSQHYLVRYWPVKAALIDMNRRESGDYYRKPTQFFFINCEPSCHLLFDEPIAFHKKRIVVDERGVSRSEISPDYARRFIRTYLL